MKAVRGELHPALSGIGVRGFRSFGWDAMQYVGPMANVHLLVGPNDAGKSNLLRIVARALPALREGRPLEYDADLDAPGAGADRRVVGPDVAVCVPLDEARAAAAGLLDRLMFPQLRRLLAGGSFDGPKADSACLWLELALATEADAEHVPTPRQVADLLRNADGLRLSIGSLAVALSGDRSGDEGSAKAVLTEIARRLEALAALPDAVTVLPQRRLLEEGARRLGALRLPSLDHTGKQERFAAISDFVGDVLGRSFTLEPTLSGDQLMVTMDESGRRPLESFGAGLEQLIILAEHANTPGPRLILTEEPEVHLHPTMQRRFLRRLAETPNEYLIATHSPHMLDAKGTALTAISRAGAWSVAAPAVQPDEVAALGQALGIRASDLVQANAVVWVEGPSDRIYLRAWIHDEEPRLIEGIHYSIMMYGGSLLAWLSADDVPPDALVALPRLNRSFAVVADSDRTQPDDPLTAAKRVLADSLAVERPGQVGWVTEGYTIESYIAKNDLRAAVAAVHPGATFTWSGGLHANPLGSRYLDRRPNKVAIAWEVTQRTAGRDRWTPGTEAPRRLSEIVQMLRGANDLDG